jgi:hypothetical protein
MNRLSGIQLPRNYSKQMIIHGGELLAETTVL